MADDGYEDAADRMESLALRGNRNKGRGSRGGGKGGGAGQDRELLISKALSTLLRHQAQNAGIKLDGEGFAPLDKVMQWQRLRSLKPTFAEIQAEVAGNAKQRFTLKPNPATNSGLDEGEPDPAAWLIRANQGHSIKLASEGLHAPITLEGGNVPDVVVHGTYFAFWPKIVEAGGLKRMGRQHVHFGTGLPEDGASSSSSSSSGNGNGDSNGGQVHEATDEKGEEGKARPKVISGMRSDAEVLVFVDVERSLRDGGIKWWLSANGVVLTEGNEDGVVPLRYFREVRGRRQGVGVLWRDGEEVARLPDGVVARVPMGKTRDGGTTAGGRGGGERGRGGRRGGGGGRRCGA